MKREGRRGEGEATTVRERVGALEAMSLLRRAPVVIPQLVFLHQPEQCI